MACLTALLSGAATAEKLSYPIVDTGQIRFYDDQKEIRAPQSGDDYFGQDASYRGNQPSYRDNGDGTVSDLVTGLMWIQSPGKKLSLKEAADAARQCRTGGHSDWRIPTIKELYSLILFSGTDPDPMGRDTQHLKPFINAEVFDFQYGTPAKGERIIDSQYGTQTLYVSTTMRGARTMFGVNFADGRIKGYPADRSRRGVARYSFLLVRGNPAYGQNKFIDNKDGTITDKASGLTWMAVDSGALKAGRNKDGKLNWQEALAWSENLTYAGKTDWRLPNIKELQSIVDYTRSPKTSKSPAIHPLFQLSVIKDEGGKANYPFLWSGSSHISPRRANTADYIAFGESLGWMKNRQGAYELMDVHGAGSQRSDPKSGDPAEFPKGRGPQGDVIRINNHVLCVRGGAAEVETSGPALEKRTSRPKQAPARSGADFIRRLDKNSDGKVSPDEFDGPRNRFGHFDLDGDGFISPSEAPTGPPTGRRSSQ
ncbi:DUF1566 domain-containing protein [Oceaniferula marina]|nr:DUF1566 domain-containing protein [Oceaniferula marina]